MGQATRLAWPSKIEYLAEKSKPPKKNFPRVCTVHMYGHMIGSMLSMLESLALSHYKERRFPSLTLYVFKERLSVSSFKHAMIVLAN